MRVSPRIEVPRPGATPAPLPLREITFPGDVSERADGWDAPSYLSDARQTTWKGATFPFDAVGATIPSSLPDTLYSWMAPGLVPLAIPEHTFEADLQRPMIMWRSPAGSFGYGDVSIRGKLRDDVRFQEIPMFRPDGSAPRSIGALRSNPDFERTVFVTGLPALGYHEYLVASPKVFHSLSYGTPEHVAEIASDASKILNARTADEYDTLARRSSTGPMFDPEDLARGFDYDSVRWSHPELERRVALAQSSLADGAREKLAFAPDVTPDREAHFATRARPYW